MFTPIAAAVSRIRTSKILIVLIAVAAFLSVAMFFGLAMFPWGTLKPMVEQRMSDRIGQPVSIGSLRRAELFSFQPTLVAGDIRVPQAEWAGDGDLVRIGEMRLRVAAWSLLVGDPRIKAVSIDRARLNLVRDRSGRESWQRRRGAQSTGGGRPHIDQLVITDTILSYRDEKRDRSVVARIIADDERGLIVQGKGMVKGTPVSLNAKGARISGDSADRRWPFALDIDGPAVGFAMRGEMDRALDIGHFTAKVKARGSDLAMVDALIEAGLPATQPVQLTATVTRDAPDWTIAALKGNVGQSDVAGDATIRKRDGRTRIDGAIRSERFDFDDLASDAGKGRAAAKRARLGPRLVPDTAIDLATVDKTDGKLEFSVRQLVWPGPSPFRSMKGTLTLERQLLIVDPLVLGLAHGRIEGSLRIDQREGGPIFATQLALHDGRLADFFPDAAMTGSLIGRIRLTGPGRTVRAAIGGSEGMVGLVARDGVIPARVAVLLGQDVGRGLATGKDDRATLRCLVARFDVRGGVATANPVIVDTSRAQTRAKGTIRLADERLMLVLAGAPKKSSLLRVDGEVPVQGTIKQPDIQVPKSARSVGGVIKMIGDAIGGKKAPLATDADCDGLSRRALR